MDREQLRQMILTEAQQIQNSVVWRFMSSQQRQLSLASQSFWAQNNSVVNAALDALVVLYVDIMRFIDSGSH